MRTNLANGLWRGRGGRGIAIGAIVLAAGGLVLARSPGDAQAKGDLGPTLSLAGAKGSNAVTFQGPGAHGRIALSHRAVKAGSGDALYAEIKLAADADDTTAKERAPLALALVLDTSGSMDGDKIARAKDAVMGVLHDMRDEDQVAFVRYSSEAETLQPLARMGDVRGALEDRVRGLQAGGGTNIPAGLQAGLAALGASDDGRVRRIVLASDGLDGTKAQAERLASDSAERGITVSSMGIGLDFDEGYMSAIARDGHGNFGFVNDGPTLATFLHREMDEAAKTTVENAVVRVTLPSGVRFVRASGADAKVVGGEVVVKMGALFAGDERRALLELKADLDVGDARSIGAVAAWHRVGGGDAKVEAPSLSLVATNDAAEVQKNADGAVLASAASVIASQREIEAAKAYADGDQARARSLVHMNLLSLSAAAAAAPAPAASALARQKAAYDEQLNSFTAAPTSDDGKRAAKVAAAQESSNLSRASY